MPRESILKKATKRKFNKTTILAILMTALVFTIFLPMNLNRAEAMPIQKRALYLNSTYGFDDLLNKNPQDPRYFSIESYRPLPPSGNAIIIPIAQNALFASSGTTPKEFQVFIPPVNAKAVFLNITIRETGGAQYDRPFYVFANGIPLVWGSTQEIFNSTALLDVTYYENLLRGNVRFDIILINYLAPRIGIRGVYYVNATLYLYPGNPPLGLPNAFIPLFPNQYNLSLIRFNPRNYKASMNVSLPSGTYRMTALLYSEGLGLDEFWYTLIPAFRNILLYYDNYLAGVFHPYETIYTGGISPFYWRPITSVNTLAFHSAYMVDLTPMLALGQNAMLNLTVTDLNLAPLYIGSYALGWYVSGVLFLWVDSNNPLISGSLNYYSSYYKDTGPILSSNSYLTYIQSGSYSISSSASLNFLYGRELATFTQSGSFFTKQYIGETFQNLTLIQSTTITSSERGFYNAFQYYGISYPIVLNSSFTITPITNPNQIPYDAIYTEIDYVNPGLQYSSITLFNGYRESLSISENVVVNGQFSFLLRIINQYGGAIILGITSNNVDTRKYLIADYSSPRTGWIEFYYAEAVVNSPSQRYGNLVSFVLTYLVLY